MVHSDCGDVGASIRPETLCLTGIDTRRRLIAAMEEASDKPQTVTAYIADAPKETQKRLREMRACLKKAAPGAKESLKWGSPALSYDRILFMFAAFKKHVSLFPTPAVIKVFAPTLKNYKFSRATIQFPLEKPLPVELIREIALYRVKEAVEKDAKWM